MDILEQANAIKQLHAKQARIEGMKLIAISLISTDGSIKLVEKGLGKSLFNHLLSELRQQINTV